MIAQTIRSFIARNIRERGLAETYEADVLTISAIDLARFADELRSCCDGDSVALAEMVAADWGDSDGDDRLMPSPEVIDRLERDMWPALVNAQTLPLQRLASKHPSRARLA